MPRRRRRGQLRAEDPHRLTAVPARPAGAHPGHPRRHPDGELHRPADHQGTRRQRAPDQPPVTGKQGEPVMIQVLWLGALLGAGAALAVGPIFVTILQTAATRGFAAAFRVIIGSATADLILLIPALAFAWIITATVRASFWVGLAGALFFLGLAAVAVRDARRI